MVLIGFPRVSAQIQSFDLVFVWIFRRCHIQNQVRLSFVHAYRCVSLGFSCQQPAKENCRGHLGSCVSLCAPAVWLITTL